MKEIDKKTRCWPSVIIQKNFDTIIKIYFQKKLKKRYSQEVQSFYKTPSFGLATQSTSSFKEINQRSFKNVIKEAQENVFLLNSIIIAIELSSWRISLSSNVAYFWLISIKINTILVILYCSIYWNNSNYIPLLIALYLYTAKAQGDTITLLNHLSFLLLYDVLKKKLKEIIISIISWIKSQGSNPHLFES